MAAVIRQHRADGECLSRRPLVAYSLPMTDKTEDSALMLRYRDGDVPAFEALYSRHKDPLYRYLLRLSMSREVAEDVFQEAWGKIIRARSSYRPTAKFSTYLFRVAHNCFIDHVRRNKRHSVGETSDPDNIASPDSSPETRVEETNLRERMVAGLNKLPEEQREVFLLYEDAGLGIDEIAAATGVNRETIKSRLRYANTKLKNFLLAEHSADLSNE